MAENEISPLLQKYKDLLVPNCMAAMDIAMTKVRDHARQNHRYRDRTGAVTKSATHVRSASVHTSGSSTVPTVTTGTPSIAG